jgi:hypothetical protein
MIKLNVKYWVYLLLVTTTVSFCSCGYFGGSEYNRLVKKELAKGTRSDSLFFGIYLGMPSKAFYDHCWDMNKKGLFTNGNYNTSVLYKLNKDLKYPASMNFYPAFYDGRIFSMWASYEYDGWAPWNKKLSSDSLLPDVVNMYKKWYQQGNDFITITDKVKGTIYVKVDGNRRITIGRFDDRYVKVDYTDLLVEEKVKQKLKK